MANQFLAIFFASLFFASTPTYANHEPEWSMAPAKAVMMTFWASMALVGNPDVATMMYRYVALSPMAVMTAGAVTLAWNAVTHPALREYIKNRASDVTFVPF